MVKTRRYNKRKSKGITINTDASHHHKTGVGAYAFYIVCNTFVLQKSGVFNSDPANSSNAEMMAIGNAFHVLMEQKDAPKDIEWILVNSDSMGSINKLRGQVKKKKLNEIDLKVISLMKELKKHFNVKSVKFRHVKAHTHNQDARSYVNRWCDTAAKLAMRAKVRELRGGIIS